MSWLKYAQQYDNRTISQRMIDDCKDVKDVINVLFHCKNTGGFASTIEKDINRLVEASIRMVNCGQDGKNTDFFDYMYKIAEKCIEADPTDALGEIDIAKTLAIAALGYIDNIPISELGISQNSLYDLAAGRGHNGLCTARVDPLGEFSRSIWNHLIEDTPIFVPYSPPICNSIGFTLKGF